MSTELHLKCLAQQADEPFLCHIYHLFGDGVNSWCTYRQEPSISNGWVSSVKLLSSFCIKLRHVYIDIYHTRKMLFKIVFQKKKSWTLFAENICLTFLDQKMPSPPKKKQTKNKSKFCLQNSHKFNTFIWVCLKNKKLQNSCMVVKKKKKKYSHIIVEKIEIFTSRLFVCSN